MSELIYSWEKILYDMVMGAAGELYQAILGEIEANDYDVFNKRVFVKNSKKFLKLPIIWVKSTFGYPSDPA